MVGHVKHINYDSIESLASRKFMKRLHSERKTGGDWVVTEKIHGANFCMIVSSTGITCSRRKALLNTSEHFYNWQHIRTKYTKAANFIFETLTKEMGAEEKEESVVRIYGELYGGYYPDLGTDENCARVQKGIYYAPFNDFIVFDIKHDKTILDFHRMRELCESTSLLLSTEPLFIGSYEEAIAYDPYFVTTLPPILGLEPVEDNICEGIVVKPIETRHLGNGSRVIIKKKNERFAEITGTKLAKPAVIKQFQIPKGSDDFNEAVEELQRYFNENRLDAVLSKIGEVTEADFPKLRGLLAQDALKDFAKEYKNYDELSDNDVKFLNTTAPHLSEPIIRDYFAQSK